MEIQVIFDTVCPWCFIGKRRLELALALRPNISAEFHWRPFLLNREMPPEGIDRTAYVIRKYGSEDRVRRIFGSIVEIGQSVEIDFAFEHIDRTPNSVDTHRLVMLAARQGVADVMVESLFVEYFLHGRNIGERSVLRDIARGAGLKVSSVDAYLDGEDDVERVYDESRRAHRLGINGVPAFVFNECMVIAGAQEPQVLARVLDAALVTDDAA